MWSPGSDSYSVSEFQVRLVTDDDERPAGGSNDDTSDGDETAEAAKTADTAGTVAAGDDVQQEQHPRAPDEVVGPDPTADGDAPVDAEDPVDFGDLSLPQRVFVAAVQNPSRGVFVVGLLAFAFSFYVAFWMVFPQVAAFLTAATLLVTVLALAVYYLVRRLR